jgi:hypothetical protein
MQPGYRTIQLFKGIPLSLGTGVADCGGQLAKSIPLSGKPGGQIPGLTVHVAAKSIEPTPRGGIVADAVAAA